MRFAECQREGQRLVPTAHKSHFVRKDATAKSLTCFLLEHPVDTNNLVGHESNFHPRQESRQIRQPQRLQGCFHLSIAVKVVRVASDLEVSFNTRWGG